MTGTIEISVPEYKSLLAEKMRAEVLLDSIVADFFEGHRLNKKYNTKGSSYSDRTEWVLYELFPASMELLKERIDETEQEAEK